MAKSYKKSIVAGSPAAMEHEEAMAQMNEAPATQPTQAPTAPLGVFSQFQTAEPMKIVQTRIPLSVYEKLNRMKYFAGQRTSIGDILSRAITEFVERHPV